MAMSGNNKFQIQAEDQFLNTNYSRCVPRYYSLYNFTHRYNAAGQIN